MMGQYILIITCYNQSMCNFFICFPYQERKGGGKKRKEIKKERRKVEKKKQQRKKIFKRGKYFTGY